MQPFDAMERLERLTVLDPAVKKVRALVRQKIQPQELRDALHGVWLGHPLHPPLTDVPIGAWTSAAVLDLFPRTGAASSALISFGVVATAPTALAGWTDWSELNPPEQRVGLVHAGANYLAVSCYLASLVARTRRKYALGKLLGFAGLGSVLVGGAIGGHLGYRRASGANHTADVRDTGASEWTDLGAAEELPEGSPIVRQLGQVPVFLLRLGDLIRGLVDRCSHLSGPLHEGRLAGAGADACVVCPWHGSTFRLSDGTVVHGPATAPQPLVAVRITAGRIEGRIPA